MKIKKILALAAGVYTFIGLILALAILLPTSSTSAAPDVLWDLTGTYVINYTCTSGCSGVYPHTMDVSSMNLTTGDFSGTGYYNPNNAYTWDVTGNVSNSLVEFYVDYTGLNPNYYVNVKGSIAPGGSMSGTATSSSGQTFTWVTTSGNATFQRYAEITSPEEGGYVYGETTFSAYLVDDDQDNVQWAIRKGTCAMGTNTVWGNVDTHNDPFQWVYEAPYTQNFSTTVDTSSWIGGMYCFVFNPTENAGDTPIRLTREFYVAEGYVSGGGQLIEENGDKPKDWHKISFGGHVWDLGPGNYVGEWEVNFHNVGVDGFDQSKFHTTNITAMNFYPPNNLTCLAALNFTALGEWNGIPGYRMIFRAGDYGPPGNFDGEGTETGSFDTVRVELWYEGTRKYDTHLNGEFTDQSTCVGTARTELDRGNITIEF